MELALTTNYFPECAGYARAAQVKASWARYCDADALETSEFLADLDHGKFWTFLERLQPDNVVTPPITIANSLLDENEQRLLKLSLQYRLHSAKVDMYDSLLPKDLPECETFAIINGHTYCNVKELADKLEEEEEEDLQETIDTLNVDFGHVIGGGGGGGSTGPTIILYSQIGVKSFLPFHQLLFPLASRGQVRYLYRHMKRHDCHNPSSEFIPGYGIELEIKQYGNGIAQVQGDFGDFKLSNPSNFNDFDLIGFQAIQTILEAKKPLATLNFVSENSPLLVEHFLKVKPHKEIIEKATKLAQHYNLPETIISINGAEVNPVNFELQTLLEFLTEYQGLVSKFLKPILPSNAQAAVGRQIMASLLKPTPPRFDVRTYSSILLNDLEKDQRYKQWPRTFNSLLRPPSGQFYPLARNIVLMTVIIDVKNLSSKFWEDLTRMITQMIPIQVMLVLSAENDEQLEMTSIFYAIYLKYGRIPFIDVLQRYILQQQQQQQQKDSRVGKGLESFYESMLETINVKSGIPLEDLIRLTKANEVAQEGANFAKRFGSTEYPAIFINGRHLPFNENMWIRDAVRMYQDEIYNLQMALMSHQINDNTDFITSIMENEKNFKARNPQIFAPEDGKRFLENLPMWWDNWTFSEKASDNCAFSVLVLVDFTRKVDLDMAISWLNGVQRTTRKMRLKILPVGDLDKDDSSSAHLVEVLWKLNNNKVTAPEALDLLYENKGNSMDRESLAGWCRENRDKMSEINALVVKGPVVSINGHVYGPFTEEGSFELEDIESWLQLEWAIRAERLQLLRIHEGIERNPRALTLMTLYEGGLWRIMRKFSYFFTGNQAMEIPTEKLCHFVLDHSKEALIQAKLLLNPFSITTAKISAILLELGSNLVNVSIIMNVMPKYKDLPNKAVYRFRNFNGKIDPPLMEGTKVALMLNTPPAWNVDGGANDGMDVDNVTFTNDDMKPIVLEMRGLIVEAEVRLGKGGRGIQGVPVELHQDGKVVDRSVSISFPGYTQLRAAPGLYEIEVSKNNFMEFAERKLLKLDSLAINPLEGSLRILSGEEAAVVLSRARLTSIFKEKKVKSDEQKVVHIFSIASGETYERLIRIMMLSVIKNTKAPVKFWLIDNFVTTHFRETIKVLAKQLGFSFEFITYRWPNWLNPQWRKHRRVWAHKILFLDVFPYEVDRLIYIDADQVMRGDVAELARIDLNGQVYGFVPFCENRKESEHLRFWKSGYWGEYLNGLSYHISALFVIDMERLRVQSVADKLRGQYQSLSYDPASLANLDQDLPNNLQHEVPIHSLPNEWLWCETWCDEKSKGRAKSLDLCSNPLLTESKLEQARRIIPEWVTFDKEISKILSITANEYQTDHDRDEL